MRRAQTSWQGKRLESSEDVPSTRIGTLTECQLQEAWVGVPNGTEI